MTVTWFTQVVPDASAPRGRRRLAHAFTGGPPRGLRSACGLALGVRGWEVLFSEDPACRACETALGWRHGCGCDACQEPPGPHQ